MLGQSKIKTYLAISAIHTLSPKFYAFKCHASTKKNMFILAEMATQCLCCTEMARSGVSPAQSFFAV